MEPLVIGTAGHVDHGKTCLVKAITGVDADRLKEEKQRGMTIELGFASSTYEDDVTLSFVDVPGHEKLIKTMVSGASGMDLAMLLVDAKEGIMPQTIEHFRILTLLGIKDLIIVITKIDLVDDDRRQVVQEEVKSFLASTPYLDAPIFPVSALEGIGVDNLISYLRQFAKSYKRDHTQTYGRLSIDRSFTIKGQGTIVTGTLKEGSIKVDEAVYIYSGEKKVATKVKSIQVHHCNVNEAKEGQRVALSLYQMAVSDLKSGDVLSSNPHLKATSWIDVVITNTSDEAIKHNQMLMFHTGTKQIQGKLRVVGKDTIEPGEKGYGSLKLKEPIMVLKGDAFILRKLSPVMTLGGGRLLNHNPSFKKRHSSQTEEYFQLYDEGNLEAVILDQLEKNNELSLYDLEEVLHESLDSIQDNLENLVLKHEVIKIGDKYSHGSRSEENLDCVLGTIKKYYEKKPYDLYMPKETLYSQLKSKMSMEVLNAILSNAIAKNRLTIDHHLIGYDVAKRKEKVNRHPGVRECLSFIHQGEYVGQTMEQMKKIKCSEAKLKSILNYLIVTEQVIKVQSNRVVGSKYINHFKKNLEKLFNKESKLSVVDIKNGVGVSRKPTIIILEYLDSVGFTKRFEDYRMLNKN